jgi:GNAT superfamily N-acetyltransferase
MSSAEIRPATREDLPAILALYAGYEAEGTRTDLARAERLFERMGRYPDYTVYVAVTQGVVCGTFELLIMDNLAHGGAPSGIVEDVFVEPAWQGQGIGRQMMQFAMDRCRDAGCYKLALSSNLIREGAHRFYEAIGFKKHGYSFVVPLAAEGGGD